MEAIVNRRESKRESKLVRPVPQLPGFQHETVLAEWLGLTNKKSLWRYRRLGTGPTPTKVGRQIYYSDADIAEWLQRCRQPAARARRRRGTSVVPQREPQRRSA
jgi:hypothetical protein